MSVLFKSIIGNSLVLSSLFRTISSYISMVMYSHAIVGLRFNYWMSALTFKTMDIGMPYARLLAEL